MNNQYQSSLSSLFASAARGAQIIADKEPTDHVVVICTCCMSEDTQLMDHEHQIYECTRCGEVFNRPSTGGA